MCPFLQKAGKIPCLCPYLVVPLHTISGMNLGIEQKKRVFTNNNNYGRLSGE